MEDEGKESIGSLPGTAMVTTKSLVANGAEISLVQKTSPLFYRVIIKPQRNSAFCPGLFNFCLANLDASGGSYL